MTETVAPDPHATCRQTLWAAAILFATAVGFITRITFWGEPANSLHMKALDGWLGIVWVAAALVGGAIVPTVMLARKGG